jgi:hypothetical protein
MEVDQTFLKALKNASDLLELEQVAVDPMCHVVNLGAKPALFRSFAPIRPRPRGDELVLIHEFAPPRIQRGDVRDDTADERKGFIRFG